MFEYVKLGDEPLSDTSKMIFHAYEQIHDMHKLLAPFTTNKVIIVVYYVSIEPIAFGLGWNVILW